MLDFSQDITLEIDKDAMVYCVTNDEQAACKTLSKGDQQKLCVKEDMKIPIKGKHNRFECFIRVYANDGFPNNFIVDGDYDSDISQGCPDRDNELSRCIRVYQSN